MQTIIYKSLNVHCWTCYSH